MDSLYEEADLTDESSPLRPRRRAASSTTTRTRNNSLGNGHAYQADQEEWIGISRQETSSSRSFIPANQNWLNVPRSVQVTFAAMDAELVRSRQDMRSMQAQLRQIEERVTELQRINNKVITALKNEHAKSNQLRKDLIELSGNKVNEDEVVQRAVEELRKFFKPEDIKATLRKVETAASRQPHALAKRVETLEQFRINSQSRASLAEQLKKTQRARVDEAISALRKLSV